MTYSCAAINCLCPIECLLLQRVGSFIIVFGIQRLQMSRACQLLADPWIASTYYSCKSHVARNFRPRSNQALIDPHRVTDNISYQARKDQYKFYTLLGNQGYSFCAIFMPRCWFWLPISSLGEVELHNHLENQSQDFQSLKNCKMEIKQKDGKLR